MTVSYETENHISVLTQLQGSVWVKVFPYCLVNIFLTIIIFYLKTARNIDLSFSDKGHSFMGLMVSFLLVSRTNIAISNYSKSRELLSDAMKSCRELIQHMIAFTRYDDSISAKDWRAEIARRTVALLKTTIAVLQFDTKGEHAWKIPELTRDEKQAILLAVGDSNERAPTVLVIFLRTAIVTQIERLQNPLPVNKELKLLSYVADFVSAYHGLMKQKTTPLPFPLVQMTRTFLFLWIFTLPFGLANDFDDIFPLVVIIFFTTYGFVGLEMVDIELDDPFGDDPNDYDTLGLGQVVFGDIYISIYDIDGKDAAYALKASIEKSVQDQVKESVSSYTKYSCIDEWKTGSYDEESLDRGNILGDAAATIEGIYHREGTSVANKDSAKPTSFDVLVSSFEANAYGETEPLMDERQTAKTVSVANKDSATIASF